MSDEAASGVTNVRVAVRCRPFNTKEKANGETSCVRITSSHDQLVLTNPAGNGEEHSFAFDLVIDETFSQVLFFSLLSTIIEKILNFSSGTSVAKRGCTYTG